MVNDLGFTPAVDVAELIRRRALSPVEITRAVLEIGRRLEDALVLRAAASFEALRPWAARRPRES